MYTEYLLKVKDYLAADLHGVLRVGQAFFNVLYQVAPETADEIRSGPLDPFHDSRRLPEFLAYVHEQLAP